MEEVAHRRNHLKIVLEAVGQNRRGGCRSGNHHEADVGKLETIQGDIAVVLGIHFGEFDPLGRGHLTFVEQKSLTDERGLTLGNPLRENRRGGQQDYQS